MTASSFAEFLSAQQDQLVRKLAAERQRRWADLDPEGLVWAALAPGWTVPLAQLAGFPAGPDGPERLLSRLVEEGLCEVSRDRSTPLYVMTTQARPEVIAAALKDPQRGLPAVRAALTSAGRGILAVADPELAGAPLRRWAELATQADDFDGASRHLAARIDEALARNELVEALRWIEAARDLADLASGHLDVAILLASQRLELAQRRAEEDRRAAEFLERPAQLAAFEDLLDGDRAGWALHYVGLAGMGKTMLASYLCARVVPRRGGAAARVDFDYLNPSFPTRSPGLLLAQLATELRGYDLSGEATGLFASFDELALEWHERVQASAPGSAEEAELLAGPHRDAVTALFAQALEHLPAPVVLVLDTCEELAKISGGARNVLAMFDILEALHGRFEPLRVVLLGRRPVAFAGYGGWTAVSNLPARPWLRRHEIGPFSDGEARMFLGRRGVRAELVEVIIELSRTDDACGVAPFELALYARWAAEDPSLTVADIRSTTTDRYVEMRIMGRLRSPVLEPLVPIAAVLGRFDRITAQAALGGAARDVDAALVELELQEWVGRQGEFLMVEPAIATRLRRYVERQRPPGFPAVLERVATHLISRTLTDVLADLDVVGHFGPLLQLLADDPLRLAGWWADVQARIARSGEYAWARQLTGYLVDELREDLTHPLRAAVAATHAAALLHLGEITSLPPIWTMVQNSAAFHPNEQGAAELELLADCAAAARVGTQAEASPEVIQHSADWLDAKLPGCPAEQLAAAFLGALEVLVDADESHSEAAVLDPALGARLHQTLAAAAVSPELMLFSALLAARMAARAGDQLAANNWLTTTRDLLANTGVGNEQRWLHWRAPEDLPSRVRLELFRAELHWRSPQQLLANGRGWRATSTIDGDRLVALRLQLLLAFDSPGTIVGRLTMTDQLDAVDTWLSWPLTCRAHRSIPPLFIVESLALAGVGLVGAALERLQLVISRAQSLGSVLELGRVAEQAKLDVVRRMRLRDEGYLLATEVEGVPRAELLDALDGPKAPAAPRPAADAGPARLHDWWRARWRPDLTSAEDLPEDAAVLDTAGEPTPPGLGCRLDAVEARLLAGRPITAEIRRILLSELDQCLATPERSAANDWAATELRLRLRALALFWPQSELPAQALVDRVGVRAAAEIALDEGELLALRLPSYAVRLLEQAGEWFERSSDAAGATIAWACAALWLVRTESGSVTRPVVPLSRLGHAYGRLREDAVPALPAWQELDASLLDDLSRFDDLAVPEWRPWLVRILLTRATAQQRPTQQLVSWIERRHGSVVGDRRHLPAELTGWPRSGAGVPRSYVPESADSETITIQSPRRRGATGVPHDTVPARIHMRGAHDAIEIPLLPAREDQILFASQSLQVALTVDAPSLRRMLGASRRIRLVIDLWLALAAWETILRAAAGRPASRQTVFHRTLERAKARPLRQWNGLEPVTLLGGSVDEQAIVRGAVTRASAKLLPGEGLGLGALRWLRTRDTRVLHLIGEAVTTSQGLALREAVRLDLRSGEDTPRGEVVTAEDVAFSSPVLDVCILQCATYQPTRSLTAAHGEQAAYLRAVGAHVHRAGVPIVVVLPPLPLKRAEFVLHLLFRALGPGPGLTERIVAAVTEAASSWVNDSDLALLKLGDPCVYASLEGDQR